MVFPSSDQLGDGVVVPVVFGGLSLLLMIGTSLAIIFRDKITCQSLGFPDEEHPTQKLILMVSFLAFSVLLGVVAIYAGLSKRAIAQYFWDLEVDDIAVIEIHSMPGWRMDELDLAFSKPLVEVVDASQIEEFCKLLEQSTGKSHSHESFTNGYMIVLRSDTIDNATHAIYFAALTRSTKTGKPVTVLEPMSDLLGDSLDYLNNPKAFDWIEQALKSKTSVGSHGSEVR